MGVVVFGSDVLIGFMDPEDAHHAEAIAWMREATRPQTERVRERTKLTLPDAYALATAVHLEHRERRDVRLASFDERVLRAHAALRP
jgi:predicted nucleic acid-binding protein